MKKEQSPFLEQVRNAIRVRHYSIRTEQAYLDWTKRYILFHRKRHPQDMGEAEALADEWARQEDKVRPAAMTLMSLACTAIDIVRPRRKETVDEIAAYGETDLLCYRCERPPALGASGTGPSARVIKPVGGTRTPRNRD